MLTEAMISPSAVTTAAAVPIVGGRAAVRGAGALRPATAALLGFRAYAWKTFEQEQDITLN